MEEIQYDYVDEVNPNLICAICQNPFINPVTTSSCKHTFCKTCIVEALKHKSLCPVDRSQIDLSTLHDAGPVVKNMLEELEVICTNRGCAYKGQRGMMVGHINVCAKKVVECLNEDCEQKVTRDKLPQHRAFECKERKMKCGTCSELVSHRMTPSHPHINPTLACGCADVNPNVSHRWSCPEAEIPCDHANMGCPAMIKRSVLATHLGNCFFEQVTPYMNTLKTEIKELKDENAKTVKALEVRMRTYEARLDRSGHSDTARPETHRIAMDRLNERIRNTIERGALGRPATARPALSSDQAAARLESLSARYDPAIRQARAERQDERTASGQGHVHPAMMAEVSRRLVATPDASDTRREAAETDPAIRHDHTLSTSLEDQGDRLSRVQTPPVPGTRPFTIHPHIERAFRRRYGAGSSPVMHDDIQHEPAIGPLGGTRTSSSALDNGHADFDLVGDQSVEAANLEAGWIGSDQDLMRDARHQREGGQAHAEENQRTHHLSAETRAAYARERARATRIRRITRRREIERMSRENEGPTSPERLRARPTFEDFSSRLDRSAPLSTMGTDGSTVLSLMSSTSTVPDHPGTSLMASTSDSIGSTSLDQTDQSFVTISSESDEESDTDTTRRDNDIASFRSTTNGASSVRGLADSTDTGASGSGPSTHLDTSYASDASTDALSRADPHADDVPDDDDIPIIDRDQYEAARRAPPARHRASVAARPVDAPDLQSFDTVVRVVGHLLETTERMERVQQAQALSGDLRLQEEFAELRSMVNVMRPHVLGGIPISSPPTPRIPSFHSAMTNLNTGSDSTTDSGTLDNHSQDHDDDLVSIRETVAFSPRHIDPDGDTPSEVSSVQSLISANNPIRRNSRWGNGNGFGQPMGIPPELGDGGPTVRVVVHRPVEHVVPRAESNQLKSSQALQAHMTDETGPRHSVLNRLMSRGPRSSRGLGT